MDPITAREFVVRTSAVRRYGFLLLPDFTMMAFAAAVEPLRTANRASDTELYQFPLYTLDGAPGRASNGLTVSPVQPLSGKESLDALFVCAGIDLHSVDPELIRERLKPFVKRQIAIGSICTATYHLARAGLLDGYRCTLHWENIPDMHDEFPHLVVSSGLFELDRDRYTCSGGTAPMDMMLTLISQERGRELSDRVSEGLLCERIRDGSDRQRMPLRLRLGSSQPKLVEAVELMESNIEEPMTLDELATHVGISRRQLERLFQKHLQCVPTRYYLEIRLRRARQLLLRTPRSIVDIAFACGFVSAPHFSKCYRDFFGIPPREERLPRSDDSGAGAVTEVPAPVRAMPPTPAPQHR
ncbi:MAG: AraC family transcriptional regulator [Acidiferrobacteraceae bacterium]|jgi:transcriptional regulator GlxA family with amidase domain|nr:AraC family transcriptional regulator [Acidiferrobacteraceae bacterium]MCP4827567.1 GlxA family transcriptional regulator [Pseudomonadota bacterium]MDP6950365.1 GlxA family transcriptional regulator [Arenicellales bacterium]HJP07564.1 GlxA family transcriptional regulator [Arenicellales bacterium]|tara:strand:- start:674 stop:1741 length:1068 start_codon:yes stop_codon:yes gene_type:complete